MPAWLRRQTLLLGMAIAFTCGWLGSAWLGRGGHLRLDLIQPYLIGTIFLISGLILPGRALIEATLRLRVHLAMQTCILIAWPLLAYAIAATGCFDTWPDGLRAGILILACLPTTIASCVVLTRIAGGDEALSLVAAASGSVIGVMICPWTILMLTGVRPDAPLAQVVLTLALQTLLPLGVGQLLRLRLRDWCTRQRSTLGAWSNRLFLLILAYVVATTFSSGSVRIGVGVLTQGGLAAALGLGMALLLAASLARVPWLRLNRAGRIAVTICCSQKSAAIGVPVVSLLAAGRDDIGLICLPIISYHALQLVVGGILADRFAQGALSNPAPAES